MKRPKHIISLYNAFDRAHRCNAESLGLAATKSENLQKRKASKEINSHYLLKNMAVPLSETFALAFRNHIIKTRVHAEYKVQCIVRGVTKTSSRRYKQDDRWRGIGSGSENIFICRK